MRYAASLTAAGVLSLSLVAAMVAPHHQLQPSMWQATDVPLMWQPLALDPVHSATSTSAPPSRHQYHSPGKPGADVELLSPGVRTFSLHQVHELELKIHSHHPQGSLHIALKPSGDLQLLSGTQEWRFELKGPSTLTLPIQVHTQVEGQHYVHIFIEHQDPNGTLTTRALATELRTGDKLQTKAYAKSFRAGTASPYRTLPASEEIY